LLLSRVCKAIYGPLCKLVSTLPAAACQHFSFLVSLEAECTILGRSMSLQIAFEVAQIGTGM
jgi:hypothetical protein